MNTGRQECGVPVLFLQWSSSINEFTYLGAQINSQNKISDEIRKRIQARNRCYYANIKLLSNIILNYDSKTQIYKTIVRPTVTYGSETWVLTVSDENQIFLEKKKNIKKVLWANTKSRWIMEN
jgi:hypothetical protein